MLWFTCTSLLSLFCQYYGLFLLCFLTYIHYAFIFSLILDIHTDTHTHTENVFLCLHSFVCVFSSNQDALTIRIFCSCLHQSAWGSWKLSWSPQINRQERDGNKRSWPLGSSAVWPEHWPLCPPSIKIAHWSCATSKTKNFLAQETKT